LNQNGTIAPGLPVGSLTVTRDLPQSTNAVIEIELGGTLAGVSHDRLHVSGEAEFQGSLVIFLVDGFRPVHGDRFEIVRFEASHGFFDQMVGLELGDGLFLEPEFNSTNLVLATVDTRPRSFFGSISLSPDGSLTFPVSNVAGQDIVVEAAPDLVEPEWTPILTNRNSGAIWKFVVDESGDFPARFFRVQQLP